MNTPQSDLPDESAARTRRQRLVVFGIVLVVLGAAAAAYEFLHGRYFESTDDAYVAADIIQITSEVAGTVSRVLVDDTQHVERGQVLVELDTADARIAAAAAEAGLARAVREVHALWSEADELEARIREGSLSLAAARADLKRRDAAGDDGAVSAEEREHARDQVVQLEAALAASRASLESLRARIDGTTIETHPLVVAAAARVREAALSLSRTSLVAPAAGTIAKRSVQVGTRIAPGTPLLAVVALDGAWVDANFKEVQLSRMRVGQPVELHADVYGDSVTYRGRIAGLGAGSGSAFAVLPAQNASGNWIKIVQRVPVRVTLDPEQLGQHPLRVGLSMRATVDLHDTTGPLVATQVRDAPAAFSRAADGESAVDRQIAAIIAANGGAGDIGQPPR
ncbi:MAG: HlyD family efflux transporter periplasmic adaptor subunit [Gammaproteobacteria bacterium]|nr:HlyD family efflux transporter periplasmic adaptor subunit [Gammaproteobacteria bacterium]